MIASLSLLALLAAGPARAQVAGIGSDGMGGVPAGSPPAGTQTEADAADCFVPGSYESSPPLSYSCDLYSWSITSWDFQKVGGDQIAVSAVPGSGIPLLTGTIDCGTGSFTVTKFAPASCDRTFYLTGVFTSPTEWAGTFTLEFSGVCRDCGSQLFPVSGSSSTPTDVGSASLGSFRLSAIPNPVRDGTVFEWNEPGAAASGTNLVSLSIHDASGRLVRRLVSTASATGAVHLAWDGRDDAGKRLAAGVYFARPAGGIGVSAPATRVVMVR